MTALESLSAAGTVQVLLGGRLSNTVTGRGVDAPTLTLSFDPDGSGNFVALPARLGRRADGWFAWYLAPEQMPGASGPDAALRIEASAAGHSAALATLAIDPADLALVTETRTLGGRPATLKRIQGAPFRLDVTVDPLPVALEGHVHAEGDPEQPVDGATVEVVAPPGATTATDAAGDFRIAVLPVAEEITLRITHGGDTADRIFRPDFSQRINRAVFVTA
ncbi:carboxypeptidase-like regulatory domain-containing protein [Sphingomonas sp. DT-207]|uniref:carboxypeptidase-like regulatory domain-containing protein n=1 Tax=Sphingomonas sp. DT-207 TaxID=3396167 RepID=UPI003F1D7418